MEWFRHDSNANLDEKLQEVLLDYGLEGYGLYWYCIELIVGKTSADNLTFEVKHDARIIARNTGSTPQKVEEMMKRFVSLGLFENGDGKITCMKVAKRLQSSATSNPKMRVLIQNIKLNHDAVMTKSNNVMQEEKRIEENRIEEKTNIQQKVSAVCLSLKMFNITGINPSNPTFLKLLEAGATNEEFCNCAKEAKVKKFNYLLQMIVNMHDDANDLNIKTGATVKKMKGLGFISDEEFNEWLEPKQGVISNG